LTPFLSFGQGDNKEKDWIDIAAIGFGIIGNLATGLGLYLVIKKERKTRDDILDLKIVANEIEKQNKLIIEQNNLTRMQLRNEAEPDFIVEKTEFKDDSCSVTIKNKGKDAFLQDFEDLGTSPLIWTNIEEYKIRRKIRRNEKFELIGRTKDNTMSCDCYWDGTISYLDNFHNRYVFFWGLHKGKILFRQFLDQENKEKHSP
jgi:hypothetical protein